MMDWQAEDNRAKELDRNYTGRPKKSPMFEQSIIKLKISNPEFLLTDQDLTTSQTLIFMGDRLVWVMIGPVLRGYKIARRGWSDFAIT
ncbi:hypothetical protein A7Q10_10450 [Methylacidiphilum caldifontis]|uniref:Uncharacterized protein n=2 Tax=Methylacidiphilum caldifontis TaxID=2795386 RepID=A0A4Y8PHU8_9BACT|nr:hypothetical protein A7Q10_10450 [Methylacidiphilum caldifontis]